MANTFRFSVKKNDTEKLIDLNVVDEVVSLSQEAVEVYRQFERNNYAVSFDIKNGLKGYIYTQLELSEKDGVTRHVLVADDNGMSDLIIEKMAEQMFPTVKCDYQSGKADFSRCEDFALLYISQNSSNFEEIKSEAIKCGIKEIQSTICTSTQCGELAEVMRLEEKITGNPKLVFIPHTYTKSQAIELVKMQGIISAKACAKVGGALAIGTSFVDVITGSKTLDEAIEDSKDKAKNFVETELISYAGNQLLATAVGQSVKKVVLKLGGDVAKTAVKSVGAGSALTGISAADAFVVSVAKEAVLTGSGIATATIAEVGGTAAGMVSSVGLTGVAGAIGTAATGATALVGTAAALVTPLAPIAVAYGAGKLLKKIFN